MKTKSKKTRGRRHYALDVKRMEWVGKTDGNCCSGFKYWKKLQKHLMQGGLLRPHNFISLRAALCSECDMGRVETRLARHAMTDYKSNKDFFLRYNTDFALQHAIEDVEHYQFFGY